MVKAVDRSEMHLERTSGEPVDIVLDSRPASVTIARHAVGRMLRAANLSPSEMAEDVLLLVSELVTNAVLHAGTDVRVWASAEDGRVVVAVGDDEPHSGPREAHRGTLATSGRGIWLVDLLASTWGVETFESSKVVWFDVVDGADRLEGLEPAS